MHIWSLIAVVLLLTLGEPPRVDARASKQTPRAAKPTPALGTPSPDLRRAIERAADYLGGSVQGGNGAWFTTQGAMLLGPKFRTWARTLKVAPLVLDAAKTGSHASFAEVIEARLWSLRWLPERPVAKLSKPEAAPVERDAARRLDDKDFENLLGGLLVSVNCHDLPAERHTPWLELLSKPSRGYLLTYQLLDLMLGYNQGCLSAAATEPIRSQLATQLSAQARADSDSLDALAIERLAMLCYAGVCDWIDPDVLARLVSEQQASGAWGARDPHAYGTIHATEPHTAALAFYVLARSWTLHHAPGPAPQPPPAAGKQRPSARP